MVQTEDVRLAKAAGRIVNSFSQGWRWGLMSDFSHSHSTKRISGETGRDTNVDEAQNPASLVYLFSVTRQNRKDFKSNVQYKIEVVNFHLCMYISAHMSFNVLYGVEFVICVF